MVNLESMRLQDMRTVAAPDGSDVRVLFGLEGGSMAHFELGASETLKAIAHRTVEEIWYVIAGAGEMWRKNRDEEEIIALGMGICLTIPVGTHFQFRSTCEKRLAVIGVTMPPWPGEDEAYEVEGKWEATVRG